MTPGFTNGVLPQTASNGAFAIEYTLTLSDSHALSMFLFDTVIRKQLKFRLKFYAIHTLQGALASILVGLIVWGATMPFSSTNSRVEFALGCGAALLNLAVWLIGLIPGSFHHRCVRRYNEKHFWRTQQRLCRLGIQKTEQNCRVVLSPEGFTEILESHAESSAVEIAESKITKVSWLAVSSIEVTEKHAFFAVEKANVSFTEQGFLALPRLAFDDEASFREFVNIARSYRNAVNRSATASLA